MLFSSILLSTKTIALIVQTRQFTLHIPIIAVFSHFSRFGLVFAIAKAVYSLKPVLFVIGYLLYLDIFCLVIAVLISIYKIVKKSCCKDYILTIYFSI